MKTKCGEYLAGDCIVSLEGVEGPADVLAAEHTKVPHQHVGGLHHHRRTHLLKLGVVKVVFLTFLRRGGS